jgi:hypothetical protein
VRQPTRGGCEQGPSLGHDPVSRRYGRFCAVNSARCVRGMAATAADIVARPVRQPGNPVPRSKEQRSLVEYDDYTAVSGAMQRIVGAPNGQHSFSDSAKCKRPARCEPAMERGRDAGGGRHQLHDARSGSKLLWLSVYLERVRRAALSQLGAGVRTCQLVHGTTSQPRRAVF